MADPLIAVDAAEPLQPDISMSRRFLRVSFSSTLKANTIRQ